MVKRRATALNPRITGREPDLERHVVDGDGSAVGFRHADECHEGGAHE